MIYIAEVDAPTSAARQWRAITDGSLFHTRLYDQIAVALLCGLRAILIAGQYQFSHILVTLIESALRFARRKIRYPRNQYRHGRAGTHWGRVHKRYHSMKAG